MARKIRLDDAGAAWRLRSQINAIGVGLSANWVDVADSASTNRVIMAIDPAHGSVFYRLVYP